MFGKAIRSFFELLLNFRTSSFQEYVSIGISHQVSYCDPVYNVRGVKGAMGIYSSSSKVVIKLPLMSTV